VRERPNIAAVREQARQIDPAEIAAMRRQGELFMANSDVSGARLVFRRAAESGDVAAAFALAETYDPIVLEKSGLIGGIKPDVAMARTWYEKAQELGSTAASERIARLAAQRGG
jgi:TPR repeat protein